jgi:hypothetical protein
MSEKKLTPVTNGISDLNEGKVGELFYVDKNGKARDAEFHEEILAGIDPKDEEELQIIAYHRAIELGIDEQTARKLYLSN